MKIEKQNGSGLNGFSGFRVVYQSFPDKEHTAILEVSSTNNCQLNVIAGIEQFLHYTELYPNSSEVFEKMMEFIVKQYIRPCVLIDVNANFLSIFEKLSSYPVLMKDKFLSSNGHTRFIVIFNTKK